jgi:1-acyl-sn-glycerol-3-phosphate acyltransferase
VRRVPRQDSVGFWFRFAVCVLEPLMWLTTRRTWRGADQIRVHSGGLILAVNHLSWIDPVTLGHYVFSAARRTPRYLAKAELFRLPVIGRVIRGCGQIPVYRATRDAAAALREAVIGVERGECLVIYPEGTCTRDPQQWPMVAKTGVARLALTTGAPVIPVAQWGPQRLLPYGTKRFRIFPPTRVQIAAGPPVDLSAFEGKELTSDVLRAATDVIMGDVTRLLADLRGEEPPAKPYDPRAAA